MTNFCELNVKNAKCYLPTDRDMILNAIEVNGGADEINNEISAMMRSWFDEQTEKLAAGYYSVEEMDRGNVVASYLDSEGRETLVHESDIFTPPSMFGDEQPFNNIYSAALMKITLERHSEAMDMLQSALAGYSRLFEEVRK